MTFVIPMAGKGSRFLEEGYKLPKYMIKVKNKTLFEYSIESLPLEIATKIIFICLKSHKLLNVSEFIRKNVSHDNIKIIFLDDVTRGQSETVYKAKEYIDNYDELLIYNIDTSFKSKKLKTILLDDKLKKDGVLGAFIDKSNDDKWSFAKLDKDSNIIQTTEKDKVSDYALTGLYHFKRAGDFFDIAEKCINDNITVRNEFYIAPLYNYLIAENKIYVLNIVDEFIPLGTPQEVKSFEHKH